METSHTQNQEPKLPDRETMLQALQNSDSSYEGIFITAVKSTGIFCRPTCSAKKPKPENVEFYTSPKEALFAGYRPCKRCRPLEPSGAVPDWLRPLLSKIEEDPSKKFKDQDLRNMNLEPARVRRWFKAHHDMTFHAYCRARRLGVAMGQMKQGQSVTETALDNGFSSLSGFDSALKKLTGVAPKQTKDQQNVMVTRITTPLGMMVLGATDQSVVLCEFVDRRMLPTQFERLGKRLNAVFTPGSNSTTKQLESELQAYFEGKLKNFTVSIERPGTTFQQKVWDALCQVPYGATSTYAELADAIGHKQAIRAVGKANGDNRLAILVPCHRIVGKDGSLVGYGGGLWRKQRLLELEARVAQQST